MVFVSSSSKGAIGMTRTRKSWSCLTYVLLSLFILANLWLMTRINSPSGSPLLSISDENSFHKNLPFVVPESRRGSTLIVAFCNFHYRSVGVTWYKRMTALGYDNHLLVATDQAMVDFLSNSSTSERIRYHVWIHEPLPKKYLSQPKNNQDRAYLELLMAVRWKYLYTILEKQGMHVVLTDADNIFTRYVDVDLEFTNKNTDVDVWHAYATKFPQEAFAKQGFCVCSGMSWWRASPGAIRFVRLMKDTCGKMCDDQRVLNNLLSSSPRLNMTWNWTDEARRSCLTNTSTNDPRYLGLPTIGISGHSKMTGHKARIWDRDFAFRGPLFPDVCPPNNWVSMPIVDIKTRSIGWKAKLESFQGWDNHCGSQ